MAAFGEGNCSNRFKVSARLSISYIFIGNILYFDPYVFHEFEGSDYLFKEYVYFSYNVKIEQKVIKIKFGEFFNQFNQQIFVKT